MIAVARRSELVGSEARRRLSRRLSRNSSRPTNSVPSEGNGSETIEAGRFANFGVAGTGAPAEEEEAAEEAEPATTAVAALMSFW